MCYLVGSMHLIYTARGRSVSGDAKSISLIHVVIRIVRRLPFSSFMDIQEIFSNCDLSLSSQDYTSEMLVTHGSAKCTTIMRKCTDRPLWVFLLMISRLEFLCSSWNSILSSFYFFGILTELHSQQNTTKGQIPGEIGTILPKINTNLN